MDKKWVERTHVRADGGGGGDEGDAAARGPHEQRGFFRRGEVAVAKCTVAGMRDGPVPATCAGCTCLVRTRPALCGCPAADACGCTHPAGALVWLAVNTHAASRHHHENVHQFRAIIKPGWLPFSTGIDLTDIQVAQPRLPPHPDALMALAVAHSL
jgi:hypothetical protein